MGTNQLFADGKMIELARWPKQTSSDTIMPTNGIAENVTVSGNNVLTITDAEFNEPNGRWTGAKIWINLSRNGYDGQGWTGTVTSTSQSAHTITLNFGSATFMGDQPWGFGVGNEYFLFNPTATGVNATGGVNALLSNGEWWKNGTTLYVKTPNGNIPSTTGTGTNVVEAKRRHFAFWPSVTRSGYTIKNFNLFGCSITTDKDATTNRIIVEAANNIVIDGIKARYLSHQTDMTGNWQDQHYNWSGIVVSGRNNIIRNCNLQYSATSALSVSGFGNKVLNNTIANTNYMCSNSGALNTGFICQDVEIANNTIYNTTSIAVNFKYAQNSNINVRDACRIHHNTIYDFMRRSGDSGAIDMFGQDGNWIRIDHNVIYTTKPVIGHMVHGIYLDYGGGANLDEGHYTLDHNVIYNLPAPILINNIKDVNIYNNVLIENLDVAPIEGGASGINYKIYNNIMSKPLNVTASNLNLADIQRNIFNARDAVLNTIFANAAGGNFKLISSASAAINQGISVGSYDENVVGAPDLGAFEYVTNNDGNPPSVPQNLASNTIKFSSFNVTWNASTDNGVLAYYEVYINGVYYNTVTTNAISITGLVPDTDYNITVRAGDDNGNKSGISNGLLVHTANAANIATAGTGYRWSANSNSYDNTNRVAEPGMNDGDLNTTINLNGGVDDFGWAHEAGGIVFSTAQNNVSSVNFIQGDIVNGNTCFSKALELQFSSDGVLWADSRWTVQPVYPYGNTASAGKTFAFSGPPVSNIKGIRVTGMVFTNDSSWVASLKEVRAYADVPPDNTPPTAPTALNTTAKTATSFTLNWTASTDAVGVTGYEVFRDGVSIGMSTGVSLNVTGLTCNTNYSMTVRARDAAGNWSSLSTPLVVLTSPCSGGFVKENGTAYRWSQNSGIRANTNRWPEAGLNDNNTTTDVGLNNNVDDNTNAYESAGLIFSSAKNITKVEYINGTYGGSFDNGSFDAGIQIQTTTNGTTWSSPNGWTVTPSYLYLNTAISGTTYTFTGSATGILGIRVNGRVHTSATTGSWEARCREISAFSGSAARMAPSGQNALQISTTTIYPNPASNALHIFSDVKGADITIYAADGKIMKRIITQRNLTDVDVSKWSKGLYYINIRKGTQLIIKKAVVAK